MNDFFISSAMAAEGPAGGFPGSLDIIIIVAFGLVFYFMLWRPQSKRAKEHKDLVSNINKGDEIVTNGGLIGKVVKVEDQYLVFEVDNNVQLKLQKGAVSAALPKGTIKSI